MSVKGDDKINEIIVEQVHFECLRQLKIVRSTFFIRKSGSLNATSIILADASSLSLMVLSCQYRKSMLPSFSILPVRKYSRSTNFLVILILIDINQFKIKPNYVNALVNKADTIANSFNYASQPGLLKS
jgi:hypothetical protein